MKETEEHIAKMDQYLLKLKKLSETDSESESTLGFNLEQEYHDFMETILEKGLELDCTQERFNQLVTDPKTGIPNEKILIEVKGALQGEAEGFYKNIRRPSNRAVDLDFEIDPTDGFTFVDLKTPVDFKYLADKGVDLSKPRFKSLDRIAYKMGKKIPPQKERFCGLENGPLKPENVLHIVNLELIQDPQEKASILNAVLEGAEAAVEKGNLFFKLSKIIIKKCSMANDLTEILNNLKNNTKLILVNDQEFFDEIILNKSLQSSIFGRIKFVNVIFKNIDFFGSCISQTIFENCIFSNVTFRKSEFWDCSFLSCKIKNSDLTRSEFNSTTFKNCQFLDSNLRASDFDTCKLETTRFSKSNLELILVDDVKVWKSKKWIEVNDFSILENDLND